MVSRHLLGGVTDVAQADGTKVSKVPGNPLWACERTFERMR
jgi:hypothetical protein